MDIMFWIWLAIIIVSVVVEAVTLDLVSFWFAIGSIAPLIMSAVGGVSWAVQLSVFIVASALMIIFLRKTAIKYLFRNSEGKTNLELFIGKKTRMLERTDFEHVGSVKVNDVVWSAIDENGQTIEKDEIVEIVNVSGNKLIVKKIKK